MRWPLRSQILLRMLLLVMLSIFAVTFANIRSTIAKNQTAELARIQKIVDLVKSTRFPLTKTVLENMKLLSGAEFVLQDAQGREISKTDSAPHVARNLNAVVSSPTKFSEHGASYYYQMVKTSPRRSRNHLDDNLHIFVPRQSDGEIWWQSSKSPIGIALFAFPVALLISWAMASQVTQPLARLKNQVQKIATGDVQQIPQIRANDEIRDLGNSINELALKLNEHDDQLRKNERLKNMVQFGNSIAHHLRNSSTGCKMAIELMAEKNAAVASSENYLVATRQLELMDSYIKKFLMLSKSQGQIPFSTVQPIQLGDVLQGVLFLLRPNAEHLGVKLSVDLDSDGSSVSMCREDAEQLMINLISNGIAAASEADSETEEASHVDIKLCVRGRMFSLSVTDSGNGPSQDIVGSLFQPFVSGKSEGIGLGLAVVQDIAERMDGTITWQRRNDQTEFVFNSMGGISDA